MDKEYKELFERNIRSDEQLVNTLQKSNEILDSIQANLKGLNENVVANNSHVHENLKVIRHELLKYVKHAIYISLTIATTLAGLNLGGVI